MAPTLEDPVSGKPVTLFDEVTGKPISGDRRHADDGFAIGHVLTYASILKGASNTYFHLWDESLRAGRENALAMRHDCFLMSLLDERKEATSSLKWHLEPDNPRDPTQAAVAEAVEKILQTTPDMMSLQHYLLEAIWYGRYGAFLKWDWVELDLPQVTRASSAIPGSGGNGLQKTKCLAVKGHFPVNGDKIGHFHSGESYIKINSSEHEAIKGIPEVVVTTQGFGLAIVGDYRERFLEHRHTPDDADYFEAEMAEARFGIGVRSRISYYEYLRKDFLSAAVDALERIGLGLVCVKYDQSNPQAKREAEDLGRNLSRRSVVTVPVSKDQMTKGGAVEVVEGPNAGTQIVLQLREYCDNKIERYMVGQSVSSGGGAGGGNAAVAAFAAMTQHRKFSGDAHRLAETIAGSKDRPGLVSTIKAFTFPWADFPLRFMYSIPDPEAERKLGAVATGINIGLSFIESEVLALTGLSEPSPDDTIINAASLQLMMAQVAPQGMPGDKVTGGQGDKVNGAAQGEEGGGQDAAALLGELQASGGGGGNGQALGGMPMQFGRQLESDSSCDRLRWLYGEALAKGDRTTAAKYQGQLELAERVGRLRYAAGGDKVTGGQGDKVTGAPPPVTLSPPHPVTLSPVGRVANPVQPVGEHNQRVIDVIHGLADTYGMGVTANRPRVGPAVPSPTNALAAAVARHPGVTEAHADQVEKHLANHDAHYANYDPKSPASKAAARANVGKELEDLQNYLRHTVGVKYLGPMFDYFYELRRHANEAFDAAGRGMPQQNARRGRPERYALTPGDPPQPHQAVKPGGIAEAPQAATRAVQVNPTKASTMRSTPAMLRPQGLGVGLRPDLSRMRGEAGPPGRSVLHETGRALVNNPHDENIRREHHDLMLDHGMEAEAAAFREQGMKSHAVPDVEALFRHAGDQQGQVKHRMGYDEAHNVPHEGEAVYLRHGHHQGPIVGVGHTRSVEPHDEGVDVTYDVHRAEPGMPLHTEEQRRAYEAGFTHGDKEFPSVLTDRLKTSGQARAYLRDVNNVGIPAEQVEQTWGVPIRDMTGRQHGTVVQEYADHLARQEAMHPADRRYHDLGSRDAERMLPFAHSVEGMRSQDPADDQDRWAVKHALTMRPAMEKAFAAKGLPATLLNVVGGQGASRPGRGNSWTASGEGGAAVPMTNVQNPVVHTLLDEAYPRWQQHLRQGGQGGKEAFGQILNQVVDEHFPPDEHPYDSMTRLLDRTGNPHDVDREDYYLRQEKREADHAKGTSAKELTTRDRLDAASSLATGLGGGRIRIWGGDMLYAREILRRVKAWHELPEAVKQVMAVDPESRSRSQPEFMQRVALREAMQDPAVGEQLRQWTDRHMGHVDDAEPDRVVARHAPGLEQVARAFEQHRGDDKVTRGQGDKGTGTPRQYARAGPGDFTNPGAFAPGGQGTDYPSTVKVEGPAKPPQPWQLAGKQQRAGDDKVTRGQGDKVTGQSPPVTLSPGHPATLSSQDQDFQDVPDHDPTEPPDAYRDVRQPHQLEGMDLSDEEVEKLREMLGEEGFARMLKAIDEGEEGQEGGGP